MIALLLAAALAQPGRDPNLLHRDVTLDLQREQSLRKILQLGGSPQEQAEVLARLAAVLRAKGLRLALNGQTEADKTAAADARAEAVARYRELLLDVA